MQIMKELTMAKLHQENSQQNLNFGGRSDISNPEIIKSKIGQTLYRKTKSKNEIIITAEQRKEASFLFRQANLPSPGWLRKQFIVTCNRRKQINKLWEDCGLDGSWCSTLCGSDDWSGSLHRMWHQVNPMKAGWRE